MTLRDLATWVLYKVAYGVAGYRSYDETEFGVIQSGLM